MKEKQILVMIKEPGKDPRVEPLFPNELEAFQKAVGGYIETVTVADDLVVICNEEGILKVMPYNCEAFGNMFLGPIVVAGVKGEEFASLKAKYIPMLRKVLRG